MKHPKVVLNNPVHNVVTPAALSWYIPRFCACFYM